MNTKDRNLLMLLRENARRPVSELARRLNLSRTATQARLEKLERSGVIDGYTVRLSPEFHQNLIRAMVMIKATPAKRAKTEHALSKLETVSSLHSISGQFDLIAEIEASHVQELDKAIDQIGKIEGVIDTLSSVILSTRISR